MHSCYGPQPQAVLMAGRQGILRLGQSAEVSRSAALPCEDRAPANASPFGPLPGGFRHAEAGGGGRGGTGSHLQIPNGGLSKRPGSTASTPRLLRLCDPSAQLGVLPSAKGDREALHALLYCFYGISVAMGPLGSKLPGLLGCCYGTYEKLAELRNSVI